MRSNKSRIINLQRCQWKKHTHKTHHRDLSEMINDYCISDAFIAFMVSCVTRGNRYPTPRPSVLIHTAYTNYGGKGLGEIILDYMKISFLDLPHQVTFLTNKWHLDVMLSLQHPCWHRCASTRSTFSIQSQHKNKPLSFMQKFI